MRKLLFTTMLLACVTSAAASNYGLGVSIEGGDSSIFLPYTLSDTIFLEGNLSYLKGEDQFQTIQRKSDDLELGFGAFHRRDLRERSFLYLGARISYIKSESSMPLVGVSAFGTVPGFATVGLPLGPISVIDPGAGSFGAINPLTLSTSTNTEKQGYRLSPTIGLAYEVSESFSIAAEAEWYYQDLDVKYRSSVAFGPSPISNSLSFDESSNGTKARIVLRYMF